MTILHITTGANYGVTKNYINFINTYFDAEEHAFLIVDYIDKIPSELLRLSNVIFVDRSKNNFRRYIISNINKARMVILHSLSFDIYLQSYCLLKPTIIKKIIWVAWGYDLYQYKRESKSIFFLIRNEIANNLRKKIRVFVGIFPPDIDYFRKEFQSDAITFYASYTSNLYNPLYSKDKDFDRLEDKVKCNECINIQIGHSSTKVLNHLEVLKSLEKFKDKNIRIYLPLNYGDMKYGDFVEEKAKELFGDKAICIREMMSKDDYMEYLSTIDIAIFNTRRQIGLGNISPMLYMEKKIYMPKDSVMYNFYRSQQVDIWDYNEITNFDYSEFTQPIRFKGGRKYIVDNELDLNHKIYMWKKVFEAPLKRGI